MSRIIMLQNDNQKELSRIRDIKLSDGGYLYLTDFTSLNSKTSFDMVILSPAEIIQLKDMLNEEIK